MPAGLCLPEEMPYHSRWGEQGTSSGHGMECNGDVAFGAVTNHTDPEEYHKQRVSFQACRPEWLSHGPYLSV